MWTQRSNHSKYDEREQCGHRSNHSEYDEREQCGRSSEWQIIKSLNGKVINAKHSASYDSYESHPSSKALLTFIKNAAQCVT